jgi:acetyl esterase/lipase
MTPNLALRIGLPPLACVAQLLAAAGAADSLADPAVVPQRRVPEPPRRQTVDRVPFDARYAQVYAQRDSGPLKADLYLPHGDGPFPGVLVVHGGAWRMGTRAQLSAVAQQLAARGYVAAAISYRLAPQHPFPAQIEDCRAALRWLRQSAERLQLDPERVGAFGYSAGAQLVALLATQPDGAENAAAEAPRLRAAVAGGAPCDFQQIPLDARGLAFWLGGSRRERQRLYREASPVVHVTPDDPPMFFFHGADDELVPLESPRQMCAALQRVGVPADLYAAPGLGHLGPTQDPVILSKAFGFLDQHLRTEEVP